MKVFLLFCSIFFIFSCSQNDDYQILNKFNSHDYKAINEILKEFGGNCNYKKGPAFNILNEDRFFFLELKNSKVIELLAIEHPQLMVLSASKIAYIYYYSLKGYKIKPAKVDVSLITRANKSLDFSFPFEDLRIDSFLLNSSVFLYYLRDINEVVESPIIISKKLKKGLKSIDFKEYNYNLCNEAGIIKSWDFVGFNKSEVKNIIDLVFILKRDKRNTPIHLTFNLGTKKLIGFKFEW